MNKPLPPSAAWCGLADDHRAFVLLDPMMPSRLFGAFPEAVTPARVGLMQAVERVREFFGDTARIDLMG